MTTQALLIFNQERFFYTRKKAGGVYFLDKE